MLTNHCVTNCVTFDVLSWCMKYFSGCGSLLQASALTDSQSCCLIAVKILCHLCRHPAFSFEQLTPEPITENGEGGVVAAADIVGELMKVLDPENGFWNCARPFDLHLVNMN
jgi:hypothetical protein